MAGNITNEVLSNLMNSSNPMWVFCEDTKQLITANKAFIQKFEYSLDELQGIVNFDFVFPNDQRNFEKALNESKDEIGLSQVWKMRSKLGREIYILQSTTHLMYNNSPVKLITCFEVEKRFYKTDTNRKGIPLSDLLNIISHFDFENPRSNKNRTLLNHLKSAVRQLESIMYQEPAVN